MTAPTRSCVSWPTARQRIGRSPSAIRCSSISIRNTAAYSASTSRMNPSRLSSARPRAEWICVDGSFSGPDLAVADANCSVRAPQGALPSVAARLVCFPLRTWARPVRHRCAKTQRRQ